MYWVELKKGKNQRVPKLVMDGFDLEQIWFQIAHHTEKLNSSLINGLSNLIENEAFI